MKPSVICRIFGYYRVWVEARDGTRLQNLIFTEQVVSYPAGKFAVFVPFSYKKRLLDAAAKRHLNVFCSDLLGLPCLIKQYRYRIGLPIGLFFAALLLFLGTNTIWRVEVSGNEAVSDAEICEGLLDLGFGVGSATKSQSYDQLIAAYRVKNPKIAWMGIYTKGTTAYVRVIENKSVEEEQGGSFPANLLSAKDGVILSLNVVEGTSVVKRGDVVKAGDALVLGWMKGARNDRIVAAKGEVIARVSDTIRVTLPYEQTKKVEIGRSTSQISVNFFEKRINIFKKNNKNTSDYVIIEKNRPFRLPDGRLLPFGISFTEAIAYTEKTIVLDRETVALRAKEELETRIRQTVGEGEILFRRVWEEKADGAYVLCATVEYTKNIAVSTPFTVS